MRVCNAMGSVTCNGRRQLLACALLTTRVGEPDAGNLHVRFDEGEQLTAAPYSTATPPKAAVTATAACERMPSTPGYRS